MADLQFLRGDWAVISTRLDEALGLASGERQAWLAALDEPSAVKAAIERLLAQAAGVETDDFGPSLPRLGLGPDASPPGAGAQAGVPIGPYRLIRELGVGGMGAVWLAERSDGG